MFAFALWERNSGRLVLARDRLGIKPLYYVERPGSFRFASTLPALLAAGGVDTTIDTAALHHYMSWHAVVPAPMTIIKGVRKLVPATVCIIEPDGRRREIEAPLGVTLMEVARQNNVRGVVAQCGGACACATCHVYVGAAVAAKLEPREEMEEGMLELAWEPRADSRLSCQIHITADIDGLEVTVPARQRLT